MTRGWCDQIAPQLRTALEQAPFWSSLRYLEMHEDSKPRKLTAASLDKALKATSSRGWKLFSDENEQERVSFAFEKNAISPVLRILLHEEAWRELARPTVEWFSTCLSLLGHPKVLPSSGVSPDFDPDLPRQRLPDFPTATYVQAENVVDILDERIIGHFPQWEGDPVVARMLASEPVGFHRRVKEGYVILSFAEDLTDEDQLSEARMRHERWLAKMIVPG